MGVVAEVDMIDCCCSWWGAALACLDLVVLWVVFCGQSLEGCGVFLCVRYGGWLCCSAVVSWMLWCLVRTYLVPCTTVYGLALP